MSKNFMTFNKLNDGLRYLNEQGLGVINRYMVIAKLDIVDFINSLQKQKDGPRNLFLATLALKKLSGKCESHIAMVMGNENADCTKVELDKLKSELEIISEFTDFNQFHERGYYFELISDGSGYEAKYYEYFWFYWAGVDRFVLPNEYRMSLQNFHKELIQVLAEENCIDKFYELCSVFHPDETFKNFKNKDNIAQQLTLNLLYFGSKFLKRHRTLDFKIKDQLMGEYFRTRSPSKAAGITYNLYHNGNLQSAA